LMGRDGPDFAATLRAAGVVCEEVGRLELAVTRAFAAARPGGGVPLSPAAARFDQFANFEERGAAFAALARGLA